jgi:HK97 family phage major capsid protein
MDKVKNLREMLGKRAELVTQARAIDEKAEKEGRKLSAEETANFDKAIADADAIGVEIEREQKLMALEKRAIENVAEAERARQPVGSDSPEVRKRVALRKWIAGGRESLAPEELRDLSFGVNIQGGYLTPPEDYVREIIKQVDDYTFIRPLATKMTVTNAQDLGIPTLDANPADADWTTELATGTNDTTMVFGKRTFKPNPLAKRVLISNKLLRASVFNVEDYIRDRLAYKFGIPQEKAFLVGDGVNKPLGVFTASTDGIDTSRDINEGNSTTAIAFDNLIAVKYSLKAPYWNKAQWLFSRAALKQIAKLKDGDGQYIWFQSVRMGEPDMLLGRPFMMSEYCPATFTTGLYVGILGDFSKYYVVDSLDLQFQRLVELYAEANQTGIIGRLETDGAPVLAEAFARVTLA